MVSGEVGDMLVVVYMCVYICVPSELEIAVCLVVLYSHKVWRFSQHVCR